MTINPETRPLPHRRNSELTVLEQPLEWLRQFQQGWLAHYERTGEIDWSRYNRPENSLSPPGRGIELARSRILLISTAGAYLRRDQPPFDAADPLGDYSLRLLPLDTPFERIDFSHPHYDPAARQRDPQVLLPLEHMRQMESDGLIREALPEVVSFMGHQPNVLRTIKELIPAAVAAARKARAHGALIVPASPLCVQTAGLLARALELNGIAAVLITWNAALAQFTAPPRVLVTGFERGAVLGAPGDAAQQRRTLMAALALLEQPAPLAPVTIA